MKQITLFSIFLALAACGERTQTASELLVADKDVDCPKQEIYLEDIADVDYIPLMTTDSILVNDYPPESVTPEGIAELASLACLVNEQTENIGARRLHTLLERVLEEVSFEAPQLKGQKIAIDRQYVQAKLQDIAQSRDLSRFIL